MEARLARGGGALVTGLALLGVATPQRCAAEVEPPAPSPLAVVAVDFGSIPKADLRSLRGVGEAPQSVPEHAMIAGLRTKRVGLAGAKAAAMRHHKRARHWVDIEPVAPAVGALYLVFAGGTDYSGESIERADCGERHSLDPLRWETVTIEEGGNARLQVQDLWFDARACALGPGPMSTVLLLKPIAWQNTKPWLFAARDDKTLLLLLPRSADLSAETMFGAPTTVRGGFTRVTLPLGRWGSGSIRAMVPELGLDPQPNLGAAADEKPAVEVSVELVQTQSEAAPTLLVRTRQTGIDSSGDAHE
jgi:hypothetical protein